jgi:UDP-2,3-diacylglucosamine hydrolase
MALARFVGRSSRKAGESRIIKMEEYLQWANCMLKKTGADYCILGHHHISGVWNVENGVVASAGDWIKKLTCLQMEAGEINILNYDD